MLYLLIGLFFIAAGIGVLRYGARPERVVLQIWMTASLLDAAYHLTIGPTHYRQLDLWHFTLDAGMMAGFLWVALSANRVWPLWVAALQMQPLVVHLSMFLQLPSQRMAYWLMMAAPADLEILIIVLGTIAHVQRQRRIGPYRDWRLT